MLNKIKKISIIIPVFNEINHLEESLKRVEETNFCNLEKEIIIVNDASNDGTSNLLENLKKDYKIFHHDFNQGKGAAIVTGLKNVTGELVVIQDADLEYHPKDYLNLIKLIINGEAQVVYGSRFLNIEKSEGFSLSHKLGNIFLTFITNILFNTKLTDMETCYKAFDHEVIKGLNIKSKRFEFEPEITAKILKKGIKIKELPISYRGRNAIEGKKITWKDGFHAIFTLFKYKFFD
ncbi:MAG: glycosyl transferase [Candidatus Melainabacteria bacterium LEY3_CP_29_8]|nr:MAG: glycosyl transferase [Candidatus Melainabacteria bacterium LEY3_CP_29_8]